MFCFRIHCGTKKQHQNEILEKAYGRLSNQMYLQNSGPSQMETTVRYFFIFSYHMILCLAIIFFRAPDQL